ncbi:MAG TPA: alanine dehydrogenase, partial [Pseudolysinimonas sp.]|nr:alanine dehydrogenase [Pseudolysinimonas sp.]
FRDGLVLFTYLHLAAEPELTAALVDAGVTGIAYETVQLPNRALPLLAPMSEVAGRLAPIVGANVMLSPNGGPGLLVPGVPGTRPANVVVLGGGVAGTNAVAVSVGLGADVTVLDTNIQRLRELDAHYAGRIRTIASNSLEIERAVLAADLVIGSVLVPGAKAPKLVTNALVARMKPGSVLVDIAVDQGGCFEDTHPTTHADPTYPVHGSLFYAVANMPGAVAHTSTYALTNATLPYVRAIADAGWRDALRADPALALGLNVRAGRVVNAAVATAHGLAAQDPAEALG